MITYKDVFLSIVMPSYNEEATILRVINSCIVEIAPLFKKIEIVVVDDASIDSTAGIVNGFSKEDPRVRLLKHNNNLGHGEAVLTGLQNTHGEWVFLMDSDDQIDVGQIIELMQHMDAAKLVTGVRKKREDPFYRVAISGVGNILLGYIFGMKLVDINIPFKLFDSVSLNDVIDQLPQNSLVPSACLPILFLRNNFPVKQVEIRHKSRMTGKTSLPGMRFVRFLVSAVFELLRVRLNR